LRNEQRKLPEEAEECGIFRVRGVELDLAL